MKLPGPAPAPARQQPSIGHASWSGHAAKQTETAEARGDEGERTEQKGGQNEVVSRGCCGPQRHRWGERAEENGCLEAGQAAIIRDGGCVRTAWVRALWAVRLRSGSVHHRPSRASGTIGSASKPAAGRNTQHSRAPSSGEDRQRRALARRGREKWRSTKKKS